MTEQPPSAEALKLASRYADGEVKKCAADIDALCEQRVSAETIRWQNRDRQRLEQIDRLQATVQSLQSARAERPASTGEQPVEWVLVPRSPTTEMLKAAYDDARANDNPLNALDCWDSMIETSPSPPSPAAVVDYTERALTVARDAIEGIPSHLLPYRINSEEIAQAIAPDIADALSERDAAAIRAFARRVWSDTEEVAYQAGVRDTRERLQEPDVRETVIEALRKSRWPSIKKLPPLDDLAPGIRKMYERDADAALTKIAEMLK
jgi:hypothetical protein